MSELASTCNQTCSKEKDCLGAEASALDCNQMCSPSNIQQKTKSDSNQTCDVGKLRSKMENCLSVECKDLDSCLEDATSVCKSTSSTGSGGAANGDGVPAGSGGFAVPSGTGSKTTPSSGAGGANGDAPSSGTGGAASAPSSGAGGAVDDGGVPPSTDPSADCGVCEHANACCLALLGLAGNADASTCDPFSKAQCESAPGSARTQFIQLCSQTLQGGASAGIDACK
jgi:hypothetical protein